MTKHIIGIPAIDGATNREGWLPVRPGWSERAAGDVYGIRAGGQEHAVAILAIRTREDQLGDAPGEYAGVAPMQEQYLLRAASQDELAIADEARRVTREGASEDHPARVAAREQRARISAEVSARSSL